VPGQPSEPCAAQAGEPFMNGIFIVFISHLDLRGHLL
jgi:hypothetical protein